LKAVLIIGVYGLLRKTELTNLEFDDVKKKRNKLCYPY
jgi:hypothetical protein